MKSLLITTLKNNILILKVILLMSWQILLMLQISRVFTALLLQPVPTSRRVSFTKSKKKNYSYMYHNNLYSLLAFNIPHKKNYYLHYFSNSFKRHAFSTRDARIIHDLNKTLLYCVQFVNENNRKQVI